MPMSHDTPESGGSSSVRTQRRNALTIILVIALVLASAFTAGAILSRSADVMVGMVGSYSVAIIAAKVKLLMRLRRKR
jgi:hypothetical protein